MALLLSMAAAAHPADDQVRGVVAGSVVNCITREALGGVAVALTRTDAKTPSYAAVTDRAGSFRFEGVAAGEYRTTASRDAFRPDSDDSSSTSFRLDERNQSVMLRPSSQICGRAPIPRSLSIESTRTSWKTKRRSGRWLSRVAPSRSLLRRPSAFRFL